MCGVHYAYSACILALPVTEELMCEPTSESESNLDSNEDDGNRHATTTARCVVDVDDDGAVLIDGVRIGTKRRCDIPMVEQDQIHDALSEHVSKLARRVKLLESVLSSVQTTVGRVGVVVENDAGSDESKTTRTIDKTTVVPNAVPFVLSPLHPNSYLNRISLHVHSWANEDPTIKGPLLSSVGEFDFPHRIRRENSGMPPTLWVEVFPRRINLVVKLSIDVGGDRMRCTDSTTILYHANKMLPDHIPKLTELQFGCYLVYGDTQNGYQNGCRPKTSSKEPLFKNPESCISLYNGNHVPAFYHTTANKKPVTVHNGTLVDGRILFKDICFSQQALSSCVLMTDGAWRLCVRAMHPALKNMLNFSVLTSAFYTGRRVRPVKPKPTAGDD